jgi:hypothetical protein
MAGQVMRPVEGAASSHRRLCAAQPARKHGHADDREDDLEEDDLTSGQMTQRGPEHRHGRDPGRGWRSGRRERKHADGREGGSRPWRRASSMHLGSRGRRCDRSARAASRHRRLCAAGRGGGPPRREGVPISDEQRSNGLTSGQGGRAGRVDPPWAFAAAGGSDAAGARRGRAGLGWPWAAGAARWGG